jgi:predicted RNA binding protein YcfA (HicA-like mRNA interferase family)
MKRIDLIRELEKMGCVFMRHGGRHDWYQNPVTKNCQPLPRHREIQESLARNIIKILKDEM